MLDTFDDVWGKVLLRVPGAGSLLARDWVTNAFRRIAERRRWSWLVKFGQFVVPAVYNTGTVTVTRYATAVTGLGTTWTTDMVGRQFRLGTATPIYTIADVTSATTLELDTAWGSTTTSGVTYEIYQCFFTPPSDFHAFICLWDPAFNWQLYINYSQQELNAWDAQRANSGQAYLLAARDYSKSSSGTVTALTQVTGTGPDPVITGTYTGATDAIFTIECTTGGAALTAVFRWKKADGSWTSNVTTDTLAQDLQEGVQVYWPDTVVYVDGDVWVTQARVVNSVGLPRYELWPHNKANYVYPFLYEARATDLQDTGAVLPRYIRGDVLLEMALAEASEWPGAGVDRPNPYFNMQLALMKRKAAETMILELERQDDNTYLQDAFYQPVSFPYAPFPDANWLQRHAL
jgi:hypothetical protein